MQKHLVTIVCILVLLFQGGFNDSIWSLAGVLASVFLIFKAKNRPFAPITVSFLLMILIYCVAMFYQGVTFEALASINRVIVVFLMLMVFSNLEADIDSTILITGLVAAGIGIAAFSGIITWNGAVISQRLQSTFQYANAAGLFFAISAFVAHQHEKRKPYAILLETSMFLTQSVGAIIVYFIGWVVFAIIKKGKVNYTVYSLMLALISAILIFGIVYIIEVPQLGILPPIIIFVIWKRYQQLFTKFIPENLVIWMGAGILPVVGAVLLLTRGLRPLATYIERIIQSIDGINVMLRYPFGLGPGSWPFYFTQYQSAAYEVSKIHSEYVAMGVNAGFLVIIPIFILLVYWYKHQKWDYMSICTIMILIHAFMDIPFSFLTIIIMLAMLVVKTMPETKPIPMYTRFALVIPIALCALVFSTTAIRNRAAWLANSGEVVAAIDMLDNRLIRNDTDAILTQMSLFALLGDFDNVERLNLTLSRPTARAYLIRASSHLDNQLPNEAIHLAITGIELAPHSVRTPFVTRRILPYLNEDEEAFYRQKIAEYREGVQVNPLFIYITRLREGG